MSAATCDRQAMRRLNAMTEADVLAELTARAAIEPALGAAISRRAEALVETLRQQGQPGLMAVFLAEYGLSTDEGVALMCLAEALLRVPDADTMDALIEDKIAPSSWGKHLGQSSSPLVNASTWALMLTGRLLDDTAGDGKSVAGILRTAVRRLGEPLIRSAVKRAMQELGSQFVLGQDIDAALQRAAPLVARGYTFSYDMLGEAALTRADADRYFERYRQSLRAVAARCSTRDPRRNPGISIKLSALHPRYEYSQSAAVVAELVPRVMELATLARSACMGLTIDAEEAGRLELSLDVIAALAADPGLQGWDGLGVAVQAYGKRASAVIDWLYRQAAQHGLRMMVRLVKGAYWDSEIKRAQIDGLDRFPVFTTRAATDASYLACAKQLLACGDRLYPQFATHNAHTVCAILALAGRHAAFELQRLHGMGAALHELVKSQEHSACRIYAPVGVHRDLLAYLVRRLLENGANSSFVNQLMDTRVSARTIAADPLRAIARPGGQLNRAVVFPPQLYAPARPNSRGWDLTDADDIAALEAARAPFAAHAWQVAVAGGKEHPAGALTGIFNPARPAEQVGTVAETTPAQLQAALARARPWAGASALQRAETLRRAATLYEDNTGELLAALCREAGKTLPDALAELREAVDFLRYYAAQAEGLEGRDAAGLFACISPWNFPLAIFTGQVAAALAVGNGVLAKPAEATPITAMIGVRLLHAAGVPDEVLQLLPGKGASIGAALTSDARIRGVCFTGSTATARRINRAMAAGLCPGAPLIAETGGINAMVVDSTALPEQAVKAVLASAFQSAGQRCSALRILYVQDVIAPSLTDMLVGAMETLQVGDPWRLATDIGPLISAAARREIEEYIDSARRSGRLLKALPRPAEGWFVGPSLISVGGIGDLPREVFGPVLHLSTFRAGELDALVDAINASGYGLTFGLHTRIDDRVERCTRRLKVGNIYVNRNQIGAVVGSQPFGGEGLSGTGPKAGGPRYLQRFVRAAHAEPPAGQVAGPIVPAALVQAALDAIARERISTLAEPLQTTVLPGPTGESNCLSLFGRGAVLCLGPGLQVAQQQARIARAQACTALVVAPGATGEHALAGCIEPATLAALEGIAVVAYWGSSEVKAQLRRVLAARGGAIIPLVCDWALADYCVLERHVCIDTTASGGNASLLAGGGFSPPPCP